MVITSGGSGYSSPPNVVFVNGPPDLDAVATIDPISGTVTGVSITNQGRDENTEYNPLVYFTGGISYSEVMLNAFAEVA